MVLGEDDLVREVNAGLLALLPQVSASRERIRGRRWPTIGGPVGRRMIVDGEELLMFGCNDYLGMGADPMVVAAARRAVDRFGSGHGMNPVLGVTEIHRELVENMKDFTGCEDVLLFNTCTAANCALIPTIVLEGDTVLSDELNHASIVDGCRLTRGFRKVYGHADIDALAVALRESMSSGVRLIVSDGVFSMEGEAAPLPDIIRLAIETRSLVAIDESHAAGVIGPSGRGTAELFDLISTRPIQTGTFSKAFGAGIGGYVAGPQALVEHLRDQARFFIYTSGMPVAAVGAALAALELMRRDPARLARLRANARRLREGLGQIGYRTLGDGPIVPILIGDTERTRSLASILLQRGIYMPAMSFPIVPEGTARLRAQVMASHTPEDIDQVIGVFEEAQTSAH